MYLEYFDPFVEAEIVTLLANAEVKQLRHSVVSQALLVFIAIKLFSLWFMIILTMNDLIFDFFTLLNYSLILIVFLYTTLIDYLHCLLMQYLVAFYNVNLLINFNELIF